MVVMQGTVVVVRGLFLHERIGTALCLFGTDFEVEALVIVTNELHMFCQHV